MPMSRECSACGASHDDVQSQTTWLCDYCGKTNCSDSYIKKHTRVIDYTKTHNLLEVGLTSFEQGDFKKSLELLEEVLQEDSSNLDAWVYSGISAAKLLTLSNYDENIRIIQAFMGKAKQIDSGSETFQAGQSIITTLVGEVAIRGIVRHIEQAQKAYFAYESTDRNAAITKSNTELDRAIYYATQAMELNSDDINISGRIATLCISCCTEYKGTCPHWQIKSRAENQLQALAKKNPRLIKNITECLPQSQRGNEKTNHSNDALVLIGVLLLFGGIVYLATAATHIKMLPIVIICIGISTLIVAVVGQINKNSAKKDANKSSRDKKDIAYATDTITSSKAIWSLILSILGLPTCGVAAIAGVITGHLAISEINKDNGKLKGRGLAIAGLIIGYAMIGIFGLAIIGALASH